jgi:monoamine oxidase
LGNGCVFTGTNDRLKKNLQVELNTPVVSVQHPKSADDLDLIKLTSADGTVYYTKNVVITAPPPVIASKIKFHPPLSDEVGEALDSVLMHDVMKVFLKFSEPVWPKDLHGIIMAGNNDFLVPEGNKFLLLC